MPIFTADPDQLVRSVVKQVTTIAMLPEVTVRIIQTVQDPQSTASDLQQIIMHDPALSSRILATVNSAFYGLPRQIASIDRAIVLLGRNAIKNFAVAASLEEMLPQIKLGGGYTSRDLWKHCVSVAAACGLFARQLHISSVDEAFLAGLIHDIGLIVSLQVDPDTVRQVCQQVLDTQQDFYAVEQELMGYDHQALGIALLEHWKFPSSCQAAAGFHHDPSAASPQDRQLTSLVHLADVICCELQSGFSLTAAGQSFQAGTLEHLKIAPEQLDDLRQRLPDHLSSAVQTFS